MGEPIMTSEPTLDCPCGSLFIPIGSKHISGGLKIRLYYNSEYKDFDLVHNANSFLSNGQVFVTSTPIINNVGEVSINRAVLYSDFEIKIVNNVRLVVKSYNTKQVIAIKNFGAFGDEILFRSDLIEGKYAIELEKSCCSVINFNPDNDRFQIEIYSICDFYDDDCCDNTPASINLTNTISSLSTPCCSETTTTVPPPQLGACCEQGVYFDIENDEWVSYTFCFGEMSEEECNPRQGFEAEVVWLSGQTCESCVPLTDYDPNFPEQFIATLLGNGIFDGQEVELTFTKNSNNVWSANGTLPCGNDVSLSFYQDNNGKFVYDGDIDCCNPDTKLLIPPSTRPLIVPNQRITDNIIYYEECFNCNPDCNDPPVDCQDEETVELLNEDYNDGCCVTVVDEFGVSQSQSLSDLDSEDLYSIGYDYETDECAPLIVTDDINFAGLGSENNKLELISTFNFDQSEAINQVLFYFTSKVDGLLNVSNTVNWTSKDIEELALWATFEQTTTTTTSTTTSTSTTSTTSTTSEPLERGWYLVTIQEESTTTTTTTTTTTPEPFVFIEINPNLPPPSVTPIHREQQIIVSVNDAPLTSTTTTTSTTSTTTTLTTPEPETVCVFIDNNVAMLDGGQLINIDNITIVSGPYANKQCEDILEPPDEPDPPITTTTTTVEPTTTTVEPTTTTTSEPLPPLPPIPPPNGPNGPGGGGGGGPGGVPGGGGGGGIPGGGGGGVPPPPPPPPAPPVPPPPCPSIGEQIELPGFRAVFTPEELQQLLGGNPNTLNECSVAWRRADKILKEKCASNWEQNPYIILKNGIIFDRNSLDDPGAVGALSNSFPQLTNQALIDLQNIFNCFEPNCTKKIYRTRGKICGGQCFYDFNYVPKPRVKLGSCRKHGLCCLGTGGCVENISKLECSLRDSTPGSSSTWYEYTDQDPAPDGMVTQGTTCFDEDGPCPQTTTTPPPCDSFCLNDCEIIGGGFEFLSNHLNYFYTNVKSAGSVTFPQGLAARDIQWKTGYPDAINGCSYFFWEDGTTNWGYVGESNACRVSKARMRVFLINCSNYSLTDITSEAIEGITASQGGSTAGFNTWDNDMQIQYCDVPLSNPSVSCDSLGACSAELPDYFPDPTVNCSTPEP